MLPRYKYTEYSTPSKNVKIYVVRKRKNAEDRMPFRSTLAFQKLLGLALVAVGLITLWILPEAASAGLVAILAGLCRAISNEM